MDDRHRIGAGFAEHMDMAHDVVPQFLLLRRDAVEIDILKVFGHLFDLPVRNGQSELLLALRKLEPEPPPG